MGYNVRYLLIGVFFTSVGLVLHVSFCDGDRVRPTTVHHISLLLFPFFCSIF